MGCMQYTDLEHSLWKSKWGVLYRELAKACFEIMYASFKEVKESFAKTELTGREIFFEQRPMRPHKNNKTAIKAFHDKIESEGTAHLMRVACENRAVVLIYAAAPSKPYLRAFIEDKSQTLLVTLYAYYPASNVIGLEYVKVTHAMFADWSGMRETLHSAIKSAMKQSVTNTDGIAHAPDCNSSRVPEPTPGLQPGERLIEFPKIINDTSGW